jgi:hypothetical protein
LVKLKRENTYLISNRVIFQATSYGGSNVFVLPSTKRKLIKTKTAESTKILSKKQRKKLEKIVDKKKKKVERKELVEKLSSVQVKYIFFCFLQMLRKDWSFA